jgi:hypothetical protein
MQLSLIDFTHSIISTNMTEIKSKREQIPANAFRASIQSPLRRMAHVATCHSSQCFPPHNPVSQAQVTPLQ